MRGFRKPKYDPATVNGKEMTKYKARTATIVPKGTAPDECDAIKKKLRAKSDPSTRLCNEDSLVWLWINRETNSSLTQGTNMQS